MIFQTRMNYAFCTLLMLKSVHFPMHKDTVRVKTKRTLRSSYHDKRCYFQYFNLHALNLKIIPNYRLRNCLPINLVRGL
jgi:hypothetical protein